MQIAKLMTSVRAPSAEKIREWEAGEGGRHPPPETAGLRDTSVSSGENKTQPRAASENSARIHIELNAAAMERIAYLKEETEANSTAQVLRDALRVYFTLVRDTADGGEVVIEFPSGLRKQIMIRV